MRRALLLQLAVVRCLAEHGANDVESIRDELHKYPGCGPHKGPKRNVFGCQPRAGKSIFLSDPARCPRVATCPERPSGILELVRDHASSSLVKSYARKTENIRRKYAAVRGPRKRTEKKFSGLGPSLLPSLDAPSGASRTTLQTPRATAMDTLCAAQFSGSIEELGGSRCRPRTCGRWS